MVKWSCSSSLCFNNYKSKDKDGKPLCYYRLPRLEKLQIHYTKILKTEGMNWKDGHICSAHWTKGYRESTFDLPDVPVPGDQLKKLKQKYWNAQKIVSSAKIPSVKQKATLKKSKRRYEVAVQITTTPTQVNKARRQITKKTIVSSSAVSATSTTTTTQTTTVTVVAPKSVEELNEEIKTLKQQNDKLMSEKMELQEEVKSVREANKWLRANEFDYSNLSKKPKIFKKLCGLDKDQFDILFDCVSPYTDLIPYPNLSNTGDHSINLQTELLAVLMICRHALRIGVMAYILHKSETTIQRIFNGWVMFIPTVLNKINRTPDNGFLLTHMPKSFIDSGHGLTDLVIDATEFKLQCASNFELNSIMFSNYKNHVTGKALIGITPHGSGILFSDVYPGSISDSELTAKCGAIEYVNEGHEIMSDRGFSIQDLCSVKGITLNRPKQKDDDQFNQSEVARNFDIAATRIHVERFIGRVRDWDILNKVWPLTRIDMLSPTWQMLCHIVNLTMPPIGPREVNGM